MSQPQFHPLPLGRARAPLSHSEIFEIKCDGFRALAYVEDACADWFPGTGMSSSLSLQGQRWQTNSGLRAVLDGETVCLKCAGKSRLEELLFSAG